MFKCVSIVENEIVETMEFESLELLDAYAWGFSSGAEQFGSQGFVYDARNIKELEQELKNGDDVEYILKAIR